MEGIDISFDRLSTGEMRARLMDPVQRVIAKYKALPDFKLNPKDIRNAVISGSRKAAQLLREAEERKQDAEKRQTSERAAEEERRIAEYWAGQTGPPIGVKTEKQQIIDAIVEEWKEFIRGEMLGKTKHEINFDRIKEEGKRLAEMLKDSGIMLTYAEAFNIHHEIMRFVKELNSSVPWILIYQIAQVFSMDEGYKDEARREVDRCFEKPAIEDLDKRVYAILRDAETLPDSIKKYMRSPASAIRKLLDKNIPAEEEDRRTTAEIIDDFWEYWNAINENPMTKILWVKSISKASMLQELGLIENHDELIKTQIHLLREIYTEDPANELDPESPDYAERTAEIITRYFAGEMPDKVRVKKPEEEFLWDIETARLKFVPRKNPLDKSKAIDGSGDWIRKIEKKYRPLTPDETRSLILLAQKGNPVAMNALRMAHASTVLYTARNYTKTKHSLDRLTEYIQEGFLRITREILQYGFEIDTGERNDKYFKLHLIKPNFLAYIHKYLKYNIKHRVEAQVHDIAEPSSIKKGRNLLRMARKQIYADLDIIRVLSKLVQKREKKGLPENIDIIQDIALKTGLSTLKVLALLSDIDGAILEEKKDRPFAVIVEEYDSRWKEQGSLEFISRVLKRDNIWWIKKRRPEDLNGKSAEALFSKYIQLLYEVNLHHQDPDNEDIALIVEYMVSLSPESQLHIDSHRVNRIMSIDAPVSQDSDTPRESIIDYSDFTDMNTPEEQVLERSPIYASRDAFELAREKMLNVLGKLEEIELSENAVELQKVTPVWESIQEQIEIMRAQIEAIEMKLDEAQTGKKKILGPIEDEMEEADRQYRIQEEGLSAKQKAEKEELERQQQAETEKGPRLDKRRYYNKRIRNIKKDINTRIASARKQYNTEVSEIDKAEAERKEEKIEEVTHERTVKTIKEKMRLLQEPRTHKRQDAPETMSGNYPDFPEDIYAEMGAVGFNPEMWELLLTVTDAQALKDILRRFDEGKILINKCKPYRLHPVKLICTVLMPLTFDEELWDLIDESSEEGLDLAAIEARLNRISDGQSAIWKAFSDSNYNKDNAATLLQQVRILIKVNEKYRAFLSMQDKERPEEISEEDTEGLEELADELNREKERYDAALTEIRDRREQRRGELAESLQKTLASLREEQDRRLKEIEAQREAWVKKGREEALQEKHREELREMEKRHEQERAGLEKVYRTKMAEIEARYQKALSSIEKNMEKRLSYLAEDIKEQEGEIESYRDKFRKELEALGEGEILNGDRVIATAEEKIEALLGSAKTLPHLEGVLSKWLEEERDSLKIMETKFEKLDRHYRHLKGIRNIWERNKAMFLDYIGLSYKALQSKGRRTLEQIANDPDYAKEDGSQLTRERVRQLTKRIHFGLLIFDDYDEVEISQIPVYRNRASEFKELQRRSEIVVEEDGEDKEGAFGFILSRHELLRLLRTILEDEAEDTVNSCLRIIKTFIAKNNRGNLIEAYSIAAELAKQLIDAIEPDEAFCLIFKEIIGEMRIELLLERSMGLSDKEFKTYSADNIDQYLRIREKRFMDDYSPEKEFPYFPATDKKWLTRNDIIQFRLSWHALPELRERIESLFEKFIEEQDDMYPDAGIRGVMKKLFTYADNLYGHNHGSIKDMGAPLSEEVIRKARQKEHGWRELAKKVKSEIYNIKGNKITAKVFEVNDLPAGITAWHFRGEGGVLIIVTNMPPNDEIIFHEYWEDYWMNQGLPQRDAHILASYKQICAFAEDGKLTPHHKLQLDNMEPMQLQELIDEYDSGRKYHHELIRNRLGEEALKEAVRYEANVRRNTMLALLNKDKEAIKHFPPTKTSQTRLVNIFEGLNPEQRSDLIAKVGQIEGRKIADDEDLIGILLEWFDGKQLSRAIGVDAALLEYRITEGDIRSFVEIGAQRRYHPVKAVAEYIYYSEKKHEVIAQRQLRSGIKAMSLAKLGELAEFIAEETGEEVQTADEIYNICKDWFSMKKFGKYLDLDSVTVNKFIMERGLKTFNIKSESVRPVILLPPSTVRVFEEEIDKLLKNAERWYEGSFSVRIRLTLAELIKWAKFDDMLDIFPFAGSEVFRHMPSLKTYMANIRHLFRKRHLVPPVEIERLKQEVIFWMRDKEVFSLLVKYRLIPEDVRPEEIDYEAAKNLILRIKNGWLSIADFGQQSGYALEVVYRMIRSKKIDYIKSLPMITDILYYIPPECLESAILEDREELERGRRFLEDVCSVEVSSLGQVRSLLEVHCMTTAQIEEALGIKKIHYPGRKKNTIKLRFRGVSSPMVYWDRKEAEGLIEGERIKFEKLLAQVSLYSDVSGIRTIKELVDFLSKEWTPVTRLAEELDISYPTIIGAIHFRGLPYVRIDFVGYRRQFFLQKSTKNVRMFDRLIWFERDMRRYERIFEELVGWELMNMPIGLMRSRLEYLKGAFSKYIDEGAKFIADAGKTGAKAGKGVIRMWRGLLKSYMAGCIAKNLFLQSEGDIDSLLHELVGIYKKLNKWIKAGHGDDKGYSELKGIFKEVIRTLQGAHHVRKQISRTSKPRGYQLFSIARLLEKGRLLLADDTRLGKTYEALMAGLYINNGAPAKKTLIVCNKTAVSMWEDEIRKHLGEDTGYVSIKGPTKGQREKQLREATRAGVRYVIVTFHTCVRYLGDIKSLGADYIIVDEAHHIGKSYGRHTYRDAIFKLESKNRVLLSATPIRNKHPDEIWPLLHWLYPEEIGTFTEFKEQFSGRTAAGLLKLKILLWTMMVRFRRDEVEKEGARVRMITHNVPMSNLQAELYRAVLKDFTAWYNRHFGDKSKSRGTGINRVVLGKLFRLREAACISHFHKDTEIIIWSITEPYEILEIGGKDIGQEVILNGRGFMVNKDSKGNYFIEGGNERIVLEKGEMIVLDNMIYIVRENRPAYASNKIDALVSLLTSKNKEDKYDPKKQNLLDLMPKEEKVVIFTESLDVLNAIAQLDARIRYIHAYVPAKKRNEYLNEFNNGSGPHILAATRGTMGESISLHGATKVIEMDLPYTQRQRKQAIDRVLGSEQRLKEIPVIYISSPDTIDNDLIRFLETKKSIVDAFIDEEGVDIGKVVENLLGRLRVLGKDRIEEEGEVKKDLTRRIEDWKKVEEATGVEGIKYIENPYTRLKRSLTREEEYRLVELFQKENNGAAFDALLRWHLNFVHKIVYYYIRKNYRLAEEKDDLFQEGVIGLMHAIELFEPERGGRLLTYAGYWIRQKIIRYLQNNSRTVRIPGYLQDKLNELSKLETEYLKKNGRFPKDYTEVREFDPLIEITEKQYEKLIKVRKQAFKSFDAKVSDDDDQMLYDLIDNEGLDARGRDIDEMIELLDKTIAEFCRGIKNKRKDRIVRIIALRIGYNIDTREITEPSTLEEIGKMYRISRERVYQIEKKWMSLFQKIFIEQGGYPDLLKRIEQAKVLTSSEPLPAARGIEVYPDRKVETSA